MADDGFGIAGMFDAEAEAAKDHVHIIPEQSEEEEKSNEKSVPFKAVLKDCIDFTDDGTRYYDDLEVLHLKQVVNACVPTSIASVVGEDPSIFYKTMNNCCPISWSKHLKSFGMKLKVQNATFRPFAKLLEDLKKTGYLYLVGVYCGQLRHIEQHARKGTTCPSHMFVVHKGKVYDPAQSEKIDAAPHYAEHWVKRLFRVVPLDADIDGCF